MNARLMGTLLATVLVLPGWAQAAEAKGCAAKRLDLERQIAAAEAQGNRGRVAGLRRALSQVQATCTNDGLRQQRLDDIQDKLRQVGERERELQEARAEGDADKIQKRVDKLSEARRELAEARAELQR